MRDRILVFVPMYNCEKQIVRVLEQFNRKIRNYITEVILVNNRSTDKGEEVAINKIKEMKSDLTIKVLRNKENYGLGGSHKIAFNYAIKNKFDYIIVLHGDDQGSINNLLPIIRKGGYKKRDCILGGRFVKDSKLIGYSRFRTFGNIVFNIIFSICLDRKIYDLGAGLNMYSINMLKSGYYMHFPDDLTFNCYMLFALVAYKQSYKFIPIIWREDDQVSNVKMGRQALQTLKMIIGYKIGKESFIVRDAREKKFVKYEYDVIYENN